MGIYATRWLCGIDQEIQAAFVRFFKGCIDDALERLGNGEAKALVQEPVSRLESSSKAKIPQGFWPFVPIIVCCFSLTLTASTAMSRYEDLIDWAGELVNRVLGDLKNWLLEHGVGTRLSPPEAQEGDWTLDATGEDFESFELDFAAADMGIQVRMLLRRAIGTQVRSEATKASAS